MNASMESPNHVLFLDDDHVIRLVRALLRWEPDDRTYATEFFLPERIDERDLGAIGETLRSDHHVQVLEATNASSLSKARAIVFRRGVVNSKILSAATNLALVQRLGEAPSMIDANAAFERGVHISCLPRRTLVHVAEHAFLLMLAVTRKFREASAAFSASSSPGLPGSVAYNWAGVADIRLLSGQTLGIVGMGEIGLLLARRARAFGLTVMFHDEKKFSPEELTGLDARQVDFGDLLRESDIVSIHVPRKTDNTPVIGRHEINLMASGSILINTSRGANVDEAALLKALRSGKIAGAGLDVHSHEPRAVDDPLVTEPNVVLTAHIGGGSRFGVLDEVRQIFDNIADTCAGKPPRHGLLSSNRRAGS